MSNANVNNNEIIKGLQFFKSSKNSNKMKPEELKNLMDKLGLKNKIFFTYNIVDSLCSNKDIKRKGGITKAEFTPYLEQKMDDLYNKEGIHALSSLFKNKNNNSIKSHISSKEKNELNYEDIINKEINSYELHSNLRNGKDLKYSQRQKNKTFEKYNFRNRFKSNKIELKKENKENI